MKLSIKKIIQNIIIILMVASSLPTQAQGLRSLSLAETLEMAGASSPELKAFEARYELAKAEALAAKEWWIPTLYGGVSTHLLTGAAMNSDGRIFTDVNRDNFWGGLGLNAEWDFNKGPEARKMILPRIDAAQKRGEAAHNQVLLNVAMTYFELREAMFEGNAIGLLLRKSDTLLMQIKVQVDGGLAYSSELLLAQSHYKHLQFREKNAQQKARRASAELGVLLGHGGTNLQCHTSNYMPLALVSDWKDLGDKLAQIQAEHPEYLAALSDQKAIEAGRKPLTSGLWKPTLKLNASSSMFGDIFTLYPTQTANASLIWQLPLSKKGKLGQLDAQLNLQDAQTQVLQEQLMLAAAGEIQSLYLLEEKIQLAESALEFAAQALDQTTARQKLRTARAYEVFEAQEAFIQAQLDHIHAVMDFNRAQYRLYVALGRRL